MRHALFSPWAGRRLWRPRKKGRTHEVLFWDLDSHSLFAAILTVMVMLMHDEICLFNDCCLLQYVWAPCCEASSVAVNSHRQADQPHESCTTALVLFVMRRPRARELLQFLSHPVDGNISCTEQLLARERTQPGPRIPRTSKRTLVVFFYAHTHGVQTYSVRVNKRLRGPVFQGTERVPSIRASYRTINHASQRGLDVHLTQLFVII